MKTAIMQPTYLPWIGYFDLILQVDNFVFLDNVQFEKRSWQQRNRIKTTKGLEWLTVPVKVKNKFSQKINEVEINEVTFYEKHLKTIKHNYSKSKYFNKYFDRFCEVYQNNYTKLCDLNISLIKLILEILGIKANLFLASNFGITEKRSILLSKICEQLNSNYYLSPLGSLEYLKEEYSIFSEKNIGVYFHNYQHPEYNQLYPPFIPYASIIDLIFNEGDNALQIILSGRKDPINIKNLIN
jgi:hypothetical protein